MSCAVCFVCCVFRVCVCVCVRCRVVFGFLKGKMCFRGMRIAFGRGLRVRGVGYVGFKLDFIKGLSVYKLLYIFFFFEFGYNPTYPTYPTPHTL